MASMPSLNAASARLADIPGLVPSPLERQPGCAFAERCEFADARCRRERPALRDRGDGHTVACFAAEEDRLPALNLEVAR